MRIIIVATEEEEAELMRECRRLRCAGEEAEKCPFTGKERCLADAVWVRPE